MKQKILSFITREGKFLALKSEPHPEHGPGGWFVVTGELEANEDSEGAVKREIKEETNLDVIEMFSLNWGSIYDWAGEECHEENFLSFVKSGEIILNEENVEHEWLDLEDFINRLKWDLDKEELRDVLNNALKKQLFFKNKKISDFRKN